MAKTAPGKPPEPPGKPKPDLGAVINALAEQHAVCSWCRGCRCGHVREAHLEGTGSCQLCGCQAFQGLNLARQWQFERFGRELAGLLGVKV